MKRAIVTGASSGIGREVVRELVKNGWRVVAVARRDGRLAELQKELGRAVTPLALDITAGDATDKVVQTAVSEMGGLDLLVNNAGCSNVSPFADIQLDKLDRILELNVHTLMRMCRSAIRALAKSDDAQIINVASIVAHLPMETIATYCASKAAVVMFSQALAKELAPLKIRVNIFSPTGTDTEIFDGLNIDRNQLVPAPDMAKMLVWLTQLPVTVDVGELIVTKRLCP